MRILVGLFVVETREYVTLHDMVWKVLMAFISLQYTWQDLLVGVGDKTTEHLSC